LSEDIADWMNYHIEIAEQKLISEIVNDLRDCKRYGDAPHYKLRIDIPKFKELQKKWEEYKIE